MPDPGAAAAPAAADAAPPAAALEWLRSIAAAIMLAAFLYLLHVLARRGLVHYRAITHPRFLLLAVIVVVGTFAAGLRPLARWRQWILVLVSVAVLYLALDRGAVIVGAYVVAVCGLARLRRLAGLRVLAALALWGSWFVLGTPGLRDSPVLILVWAQLAYSALFLVIEHARGRGPASVSGDLFYLLAFPRVLTPFFQPVGPAYLLEHDRRVPDFQLMLRGVLLGLLGVACGMFARHFAPTVSTLQVPLRWGLGLLVFYGYVTNGIFVAVALFRLAGFDLHSGYRTPWLSTSFAEFFRRYNSYVRDAVISLFYLPALGWLRTLLPKTAARIVASYGAIILGSFLLNDLLVPAATSASLRGLSTWAEPRRLVVMFVFWSAIILPRSGLIPMKKATEPATRWRRVLRIVRFDLMWFVIWVLGSREVWHHM